MYEDLKARIKKHEGFLAKVYLDSLGKATIGYGHLLTEEDDFVEWVIYDKDILEALFEKDFNKAVQGAEELLKDNLRGYDIALVAKEVIIEMVFQLGKTGVSKFKKMFDALKNNDRINRTPSKIQKNMNVRIVYVYEDGKIVVK